MARYYQNNATPYGIICPENKYEACLCGGEISHIGEDALSYCERCENIVEGQETITRFWGVEDELGLD